MNLDTPMMKQYLAIKKQYHDCLLFFRAGDFYELFLEDAHIGAKVLNITLTSRSRGKDGKIPMAGVPYHAVDIYLSKLVKAGYKVAICEQVSLPSKYGIVDREVVRVVTPGTVLDENHLEKKENNYLISVDIDGKTLAITAADISTGYFTTTEIIFENLEQTLKDELSRLNPVECILPENLYNNPEILKILKSQKGLNIYCFKEWDEAANQAKKILKKHFGVLTLSAYGIEEKTLALKTSAVLLSYLKQTQKNTVVHIKKITAFKNNEYMILDRATMINLELFSTIREHDVRGSLLNVLDQTITAMGGRLLKQWLCKPLLNKEEITKRHDAVQIFLESADLRNKLREYLKQVTDIERILSRLSVGLGNGRDLINLKLSLEIILKIKGLVLHFGTNLSSRAQVEGSLSRNKKGFLHSHTFGRNDKIQFQLINNLAHNISPKINEIIDLIEKYILDEPAVDLKSGGIIKAHVNRELDSLREKINGSKNWILKLEIKERKKTGINSLKVRFNKVFGFYIEITNANLHLVPKNYLRKQTLVSGERYITPDLKKHEEIILTAEERINALEYKIFLEVLDNILKAVSYLQDAAQSIAVLDCLLNFAHIAEKNQYIRPIILYSGEIRIKDGRHPVVEKLLENAQFVPNDVALDNISQQLLMITGPNMAGKSVFIRQVAIIILLNQIGCFVPAGQAHLTLVDRIFVRSGASDVITSGLSTFMVEMVEAAHILHHATKNSLIILDEIGRGTSTYDGISIAWAIAENLVTNNKIPPKTLFATHYHELQILEKNFPNKIKNYHMAVAEKNGEPIFLYTILPGGASHSFGVAVARLAGIPEVVIKRAHELLKTLEERSFEKKDIKFQDLTNNLSIQAISIIENKIIKDLKNLDISRMTPLEALNKIAELKNQILDAPTAYQNDSQRI